MQLSFDNKEIREICEREEYAISKLGSDVTKRLQARLADLFAAENVKELYVGKPSVLGEFPFNNFKVDLINDYKIVFQAGHVKNPYLSNGSIDWLKVQRIKIKYIKEFV